MKIKISLVIVFLVLFGMFFFSKRYIVVGDFCIEKELFSEEVEMVTCNEGDILISNVDGWIVRNEFIYGAGNNGRYFLFSLDKKVNKQYSTMLDLDKALEAAGLPRYDMSDEENSSHLIFDGGKSRKYPMVD